MACVEPNRQEGFPIIAVVSPTYAKGGEPKKVGEKSSKTRKTVEIFEHKESIFNDSVYDAVRSIDLDEFFENRRDLPVEERLINYVQKLFDVDEIHDPLTSMSKCHTLASQIFDRIDFGDNVSTMHYILGAIRNEIMFDVDDIIRETNENERHLSPASDNILDICAHITGIKLDKMMFTANPNNNSPCQWFGMMHNYSDAIASFEQVLTIIDFMFTPTKVPVVERDEQMLIYFTHIVVCYFEHRKDMRFTVLRYMKVLHNYIYQVAIKNTKIVKYQFVPFHKLINIQYNTTPNKNIETYGDIKLTHERKSLFSLFSLNPRTSVKDLFDDEEEDVYVLWASWNPCKYMIDYYTRAGEILVKSITNAITEKKTYSVYQFAEILSKIDIMTRTKCFAKNEYVFNKGRQSKNTYVENDERDTRIFEDLVHFAEEEGVEAAFTKKSKDFEIYKDYKIGVTYVDEHGKAVSSVIAYTISDLVNSLKRVFKDDTEKQEGEKEIYEQFIRVFSYITVYNRNKEVKDEQSDDLIFNANDFAEIEYPEDLDQSDPSNVARYLFYEVQSIIEGKIKQPESLFESLAPISLEITDVKRVKKVKKSSEQNQRNKQAERRKQDREFVKAFMGENKITKSSTNSAWGRAFDSLANTKNMVIDDNGNFKKAKKTLPEGLIPVVPQKRYTKGYGGKIRVDYEEKKEEKREIKQAEKKEEQQDENDSWDADDTFFSKYINKH